MTGTTTDAASELSASADAAGLQVLARASWPESAEDRTAPPIAGFIVSSFSPLAAEVARRCLDRRTAGEAAEPPVTALVVVSPLGDLAGAVHVAESVDHGRRVGPLLFFQAVPNAVAGHVAALWQLTGPVVSVGDTRAGLEVAALLLADRDADQALLIRVDQAPTADGRDRAGAVLLRAGAPQDPDAPGDLSLQNSTEPHHRKGEQR
ncbi:beta-ketoacyl synthase chain length factor [Streptacidiphilus sp. PAMC 29251]